MSPQIRGEPYGDPERQLQRPALLITHTTDMHGAINGTYLYVAFGTGPFELDPTYTYNGWVFGYSVTYGTSPFSVSLAALTASPFNTTSSTMSSPPPGYIYVMPTLNSGSGTGLGQFQPGDAGLTSGAYSTQASF